MAKQLNSTVTGDKTVDDENKPINQNDPPVADSTDPEVKKEAAAEESVGGFLDPDKVKVGASHKFYNSQPHTLRCPYSKEWFPGGNFTHEEVEVNEWIKSQVDSGVLKAAK